MGNKHSLNTVTVYDKTGVKLSDGDSVKIECDYANPKNGSIGIVSLKYKGVKSEGYNFGTAQINEYYQILLDGVSWDSFILNNEKKYFTCDSLILHPPQNPH